MDIRPPFGGMDVRAPHPPTEPSFASPSIPPPVSPSAPKKHSFWRALWVSLVGLFLLLFASVIFFIVTPMDGSGTSRDFSIRSGESLLDATTEMEQQGLIRNRYLFAAYLRFRGQTDLIKAGTFSLSSSMSPRRIGDIITAKAPPEKDIAVLIPEGFTVSEIAQRLAEKKLIADPQQFLEATVQVVPYDFLPGCSAVVGTSLCQIKIATLEGYLFPDTYRFRKQASFDDIINRFLSNFDQQLTPQLRGEIQANKKTIGDVVTVASMVEREARRDQDRALIAGVLYQRLGINMALQVDATVLYAKEQELGKSLTDRELTVEDLRIESPYNTYLRPGLPPGPIANPGLKSLLGAIRQESSPYFYYLHAPDGTTIYSRTLQEHNAAKAKYLR